MGKSKTMMATHKSTAEDHIQKITTHHKGRGRWSPRTMHAGAHSIQGSRTSQPQKDQCPACMHSSQIVYSTERRTWSNRGPGGTRRCAFFSEGFGSFRCKVRSRGSSSGRVVSSRYYIGVSKCLFLPKGWYIYNSPSVWLM